MIFRPQVWERRHIAPRDPGTAAMIGLQALGTGLSIAGQSQKAQSEAGQAAYQAQVARNNQALMEINARRAEVQGDADADKQNLRTGQLEARQRAALAAQGGDVNSGTDLDLVTDTARAGATDASTIRNDAAWKAYGYRTQGLNFGAQASAADASGANALASLPFGIGSSLLGGASSIAGKWNDLWPPRKNSTGPQGSSGELSR